MSKQIKAAARGLAALGRGEDKMLIHMTPREVEGLQALALASGGSLTINPKTGLVEAGWLSTLLPLVAGAAATVMTGGLSTPMLLALGAGAGGIGAKIEGEDPVMGALGGAAGAFGGGSLGTLAMNAGKAGAQTAVSQGLTEASKAAAANVAQNTGAAAGQNIVSGAVNPVANSMAQAGMQNAVQPMAAQAASSQIPAALASPGQVFGKEAAMAGIKGLANQPGRAAMAEAFKNLPQSQQMGALYGGTTGIAALSDAASSTGGGGGKKKKPMYYHTSAIIDPNGYTSFGPGYWSKDYNYETLGTNPQDGEKYAEVRKKNKYYAAEGGQVPDPGQQDLANYYKQQIAQSITRPPVDTSANQAYMDRINALATAPPPKPQLPPQQPISTAPVTPTVTDNPNLTQLQEARLTRLSAMDPELLKPKQQKKLIKLEQFAEADPASLTKKQQKKLSLEAAMEPGSTTFGRQLSIISGKNKKKAKNALPPPVNYNFDYDTGFTKMKRGGLASLKKGVGDGVSDSIRTKIKGKGKRRDQAAALSDGEFVIPARHVSELGNGSTDAGAKRLYAMLDRIERRRKSTPYAEDSGAYQELPA